MSAGPAGGWSGYSTDLPRQQRPLTDDRRAALESLLAKKQLTAYERGQLKALSRDGTALDQERATEKLRPHSSAQQSRVSEQTIEQWAKAIDKALNRYEQGR